MILQEPGDDIPGLLTGLGLRDVDGLWSDASQTIGVARSPGGLFIGWLDVGWVTPDDTFREMRDVAHIVEHVPRAALTRDLAFAIEEARRVRAERLRDCLRCNERFLPGQMLGGAYCRSCAVRGHEIHA